MGRRLAQVSAECESAIWSTNASLDAIYDALVCMKRFSWSAGDESSSFQPAAAGILTI
jgi:hypothetical protein